MNAPLEKSLLDTIKAPHFPIYMDYSATTPIDPRVADKMIPYLREQFGNPASRSHLYGWSAEKAVEEARAQVAALVNADPREIIWTSGATEGNNLALKGAAQFYKTKGKHLSRSRRNIRPFWIRYENWSVRDLKQLTCSLRITA